MAIGLSAGFLDPLESSGIHLSQVGIELLQRNFPSVRNVDSLRNSYNQRMALIYDEVRDFVHMHYRLSRRTDSGFWIAARETEISGDLKRRLSLYDEVGMLNHLQAEAFPETRYFHLLTGNNRLPRRAPALSASADPQMVQSILGRRSGHKMKLRFLNCRRMKNCSGGFIAHRWQEHRNGRSGHCFGASSVFVSVGFLTTGGSSLPSAMNFIETELTQ